MRLFIISACLTLSFFSSCSNERPGAPLATTAHSKDSNAMQSPAARVIAFIEWYALHYETLQRGLVMTDSTGFYAVDEKATQNYLEQLRQSGFFSEEYLLFRKNYFVRCGENLRKNPEDDGPPAGFEYDFIMLSQEYEEDLSHTANIRIKAQRVNGDKARVILLFPSDVSMSYTLSHKNEQWLIDNINSD